MREGGEGKEVFPMWLSLECIEGGGRGWRGRDLLCWKGNYTEMNL